MTMTNILELLDTFAAGARPSKPIRIVAIDLGTTNCVLTDVTWSPEDAAPVIEVLEIDQELVGGGKVTKQLVPSVVAIVDGKTLVGEGAKRFRTNKDATFGQNIWWETKNHIGTRQIYKKAPDGFKTPKDIATKLLAFMLDAAKKHNPAEIDSFIVTVPASFQLPQREDTLAAAELAGINLDPGSLLDEPIAAFLTFLPSNMNLVKQQNETKILIVDFGGGTCDVAAVDLSLDKDSAIQFSRRGVSRFHRIGGGDIDGAIAYEVLLPQLLSQNNLQMANLKYTELKEVLARLSPVAEALKISLSTDSADRKAANPDADLPGDLYSSWPSKVKLSFKYQNGTKECEFEARLSLDDLLKTVKPFISETALLVNQNEFYISNTIFSPIKDCLDRSNWESDEVTDIILVGGSSLFYFYKEALVQAFPDANVISSKNREEAQHPISIGAANHGLFQLVVGKPVLKSVVSQSIKLRTDKGHIALIPDGSELPFDSDYDGLTVPNLPSESRELTFEISSGGFTLVSKTISLDSSIKKGEPIVLDYSMDENQRLQILARIGLGKNMKLYTVDFDNPFALEANANAKMDQILELADELKQGRFENEKDRFDKTLRLAELYSETNQTRKAIESYTKMLKKAERTSEKVSILFKLASLYDYLNEYGNVEAAWQGAINLGDRAAKFNLANHYSKHRSDLSEPAIELALEYGRGGEGIGYVLAATICHKLKRFKERDRYIEDAKDEYDQTPFYDSVDLYWYGRAAQISEDKVWQTEIAQERSSLVKTKKDDDESEERPIFPQGSEG
jgi:molecular chaperone DnaK (HSP70)